MACRAIDAFGNDDAADWAYSLEESSDPSFIENTLDIAMFLQKYKMMFERRARPVWGDEPKGDLSIRCAK